MNSDTTPRLAEVRGSWEAILDEANRLAASFNDEAIPRYEKVFTGLLRIPLRLRKANNERLQRVLIHSGLALHAYLNFRDRYSESVATLRSLLEEVEDDNDRDMIRAQIVDVLILSHQYDEALSTALVEAEEDPNEASNWGRVALVCTRIQRPDQAWQWVDRMRSLVAEQVGQDIGEVDITSLGPDECQLLSYYYGIETIVAIENEDFPRARSAVNRVLEFEGLYAQNLPIFYTRLLERKQYELAMELIDADSSAPVRSGYWRGLVHKLEGRDQEAERTWRDILRRLPRPDEDAPAVPENVSATEYVLTHYQLGDPDGAGLSIVLRSLREQQNTGWIQFMLAGLGWALRGDRRTAKSDLDVAVARYKSNADGAKLPLQYWWSVAMIFDNEAPDNETWAWLRPYFQTELPVSDATPRPGPRGFPAA